MNKLRIAVGILTLIYGFFIFSFEPSYFNDDSLFLARGIDYFSVIDFSPHFPGYATVVFLGKIINFFIEDSKLSLFILSATSAILLPAIVFLYVEKVYNQRVAFTTFILSLSSPYLMNLSLSMLTDSIGLFFLFLGLYFLELKKFKTTGIILSIAFFARPSYLVFFLIGVIYLYFFKKESLKEVLVSFLLTSLFFLIFILINNGMLFLYEAKRFIVGHFSLWGRGQNSLITWSDNIFNIANIVFCFLIFSIIRFDKKLLLIYSLFITYLLWILLAQNPDSLRHLIPLVFLSIVIISKQIHKIKFLVFPFIILNIFIIFKYTALVSPVDQIIKELNNENIILISNRNIEILREKLPNKVVDKYYLNSSNFLSNNLHTYTITTDKPKGISYFSYTGRFLGEPTFYLIKK